MTYSLPPEAPARKREAAPKFAPFFPVHVIVSWDSHGGPHLAFAASADLCGEVREAEIRDRFDAFCCDRAAQLVRIKKMREAVAEARARSAALRAERCRECEKHLRESSPNAHKQDSHGEQP